MRIIYEDHLYLHPLINIGQVKKAGGDEQKGSGEEEQKKGGGNMMTPSRQTTF